MDPENARRDQLLDAKNMWAPDGLLVQRPGYKAVGRLTEYVQATSFSTPYLIFEQNGVLTDRTGAGSLVVNTSLTIYADYWYFGVQNLSSSFADVYYQAYMGFALDVNVPNTAQQQAFLSYWNGTCWKRFDAVECSCNFASPSFLGGLPLTPADKHLAGGAAWVFTLPADWAQTTLAGRTGYFVRFGAVGGSNAGTNNGANFRDLTAGTEVSISGWWLFNNPDSGPAWKISSVARLQGVSAKRYFHAISSIWYFDTSNTYTDACFTHEDIRRRGLVISNYSLSPDTSLRADPTLTVTTQAVIPEFNLAYVAFENKLVEIKLDTGAITFPPQVNSLPELVGTIGSIKSPYHPDYVPQLSTFPRASLITYFRGHIWLVDPNDPFTIRWSGPAVDGAYNIFPEDAFETLAEEDNSPITALAALNEHLVVFKKDSIWLMVYAGLNDLELPIFTPVKVVSGIGCVAPGSIQQVKGRLIFLAENGIYAFNGTPDVQKLSYAIDQKIAEINGGVYAQVSSVNWSTQGVYILCAPLKGDSVTNAHGVIVAPPENQFCFVYDYETTQPDEIGRPVGSWWFWDNFPARHFILDENGDDKQTLYIVGSQGRLFQVGFGDTDHGGTIDSYVLTHRMGSRNRNLLQAREVRLTAYQDVNDLNVTLISEEEDDTERSMNFESDGEAKFDTATSLYGTSEYTKHKRRERRLDYRQTGKWFQVRVENPTKGVPMRLERIEVGIVPMGRR